MKKKESKDAPITVPPVTQNIFQCSNSYYSGFIAVGLAHNWTLHTKTALVNSKAADIHTS
jgi:hypothetical protein